MTIDEAQMKIESVGAMFCGRCIRRDCANCNIHKAYQIMNEALEELKWYREQDLIRREDVIDRFYCHQLNIPNTKDCDNRSKCPSCKWYMTDYIELQEIPKAEPCVNSNEIKQEIKQGALFSNGSIEVHNKEDWERFQADINRGNGNED